MRARSISPERKRERESRGERELTRCSWEENFPEINPKCPDKVCPSAGVGDGGGEEDVRASFGRVCEM